MTEIDDKSLNLFFQKEKQEVKDNGFSRRVMHNLPNRSRKLSNIWVTFCVLAGIFLFFLFNGLEAILNLLREAFNGAMQTGTAHIEPRSMLIVVIVLVGLAIQKICSIE